MKKKKVKIHLLFEEELLLEAYILARNQDMQFSTYLTSLLKLAVSKDLENDPILALPQIEVDMLLYYRDNKHKFPKLPGYRTLEHHLDYSATALNNHKIKLVEKGYINDKILLTKAIAFLDERGL